MHVRAARRYPPRARPSAKGSNCKTATVRTSCPTGSEIPPPSFAAVKMALAVGRDVKLPMAAKKTCSDAPVTTSPRWIMASFAANGAPGEHASSTSAT